MHDGRYLSTADGYEIPTSYCHHTLILFFYQLVFFDHTNRKRFSDVRMLYIIMRCVWMMMTTMMMMMMVPRGHVCPRVSNNRWPHRVSFVSLLYSVRYLFIFLLFTGWHADVDFSRAGHKAYRVCTRCTGCLCVEGNTKYIMTYFVFAICSWNFQILQL